MSNRGHIILTLLIIIISISLIPVYDSYSWWDIGHMELAARAIDFLPDGWREFYKHYEYFIRETSVWPDTVLARLPGESYNHYYDSEYPIEAHERDPSKGRLPWRVKELMDELTRYIRDGDWYKVLETSGILSHYLADICQPYHTTVDYNPPVTSNVSAPGVRPKHGVIEGVHAQYIDEIIPRDLNITPVYIDDPFRFIFRIINESYSFLPEVNRILLGEDITDPSDDRDWPEIKPILENRSIRAIWLIASMWYTAIVDADALDKAPDPRGFIELSIEVRDFDIPEKPLLLYIDFMVVDGIGVPVDPDRVRFIFGVDEVEPLRLGLGRYQAEIISSLLRKYSGMDIEIRIEASKDGYGSAIESIEVSIPKYIVGEEAPTPNYMEYIIIVILILVMSVALYIRFIKRR